MIRELQSTDQPRLREIIWSANNFSEEEKLVGLELVDLAIQQKNQGDYFVKVMEINSKIVGYYCIGHRAFTAGVFDLYWIVVDDKEKDRGYGRTLLAEAEITIFGRRANLILAETSSKEDYAGTRAFYQNNNYLELSVIKDFYAPNDNLVIYGKYSTKSGGGSGI